MKENQYAQLDGSGYMRERRGKPKVIRFRHFSENREPENYIREKLMLFHSWRDEEPEILSLTLQQKENKVHQNRETIEENMKIYFSEHEFNEERIRALLDDQPEDDSEDEELDDEEREHVQDQAELANRAIGGETSPTEKVKQFLPPKQIDEDQYLNIMRSLNEKQRKFVLNALNLLKTSSEPFYQFLSGGAGVGKSHIITALVQSTLRFYGSQFGRNPNDIPVVVAAFTGKAAFNVSGMTLHCAFRLPPSQRTELCDLNESEANSLRLRLCGVKLIILEEISMISLQHLQQISSRLQQIRGSNEDFGGISIIVVGHLRQLKPICGQYPFERSHGKLGIPNQLWETKFRIFELDEIMRQRGDQPFCEALNNMSEGCMTEEDIRLISSREITTTNRPPDDAIWLFKMNNQCIAYNQTIHEKMDTDGIMSIAKDKVEGKY